jgi:hypothetical protein
MYYNQPTAAIPIKLSHDPWSVNNPANIRPIHNHSGHQHQHHQPHAALNGAGGSQPSLNQPGSPGYAVYTNGIHHPPQHPTHQHSLSIPSSYGQPEPHQYRTQTPNGTPNSQVIGSPHWQQQIMKAEVRAIHLLASFQYGALMILL